ncbi:hypothetical protein TIFTF001_039543 [Ficus carica]|uniref:Uncharacterized protein n=1 Tax=Ficus carica TaxID=3494 RepID=A0AA88E9C3_FICCA|nr:hypothetical protein TIFTF001_039543 [Ficus carica]
MVLPICQHSSFRRLLASSSWDTLGIDHDPWNFLGGNIWQVCRLLIVRRPLRPPVRSNPRKPSSHSTSTEEWQVGNDACIGQEEKEEEVVVRIRSKWYTCISIPLTPYLLARLLKGDKVGLRLESRIDLGCLTSLLQSRPIEDSTFEEMIQRSIDGEAWLIERWEELIKLRLPMFSPFDFTLKLHCMFQHPFGCVGTHVRTSNDGWSTPVLHRQNCYHWSRCSSILRPHPQ